jgi:hypothetical protein
MGAFLLRIKRKNTLLLLIVKRRTAAVFKGERQPWPTPPPFFPLSN